MNETHEKKQGDDHDEPVKANRNCLYHASNKGKYICLVDVVSYNLFVAMTSGEKGYLHTVFFLDFLPPALVLIRLIMNDRMKITF